MPRKCDWDRFVDKFKPVVNPVLKGAEGPFDSLMFETYGDEYDYVVVQRIVSPLLVWTLLDCEGKLYVAPGWHWVNRHGYFLTTIPFTDEDFTGRAYFAG